jgi:ClpP class serine protease
MSHELLRLTTKLCNTPLMVDEAYLDKVMQILEDRNLMKSNLAVVDKIAPRKRQLQYFADNQVGVVDIHGGITDIPYQAMCEEEGVSHQSIREEVAQLIKAGAKTIVLDQDSGGGLAHMSFESANYIRNLADENDVKLISYISGSSFSASYVYTAVAHEVISNPSAEAGSIGVRVQLRNASGYMKNLGIEDVYITAGEGKVPFDSEGKFTDEFLAEVKDGVLEIYDQFTDHVAMWRGLDKGAVEALGAKTFSTKKALSNGLVDKVMTLEEFKSYLEKTTNGEKMSNPISKLLSQNKKDTEMSKEDMALLSTLQLQVEEFQLTNQSLVSKTTSLEAELNTALEALKEVAKEKAEAKTANRQATLAAIVGDVQAKAKAAKMADLSDEAFAGMVEMLQSMSAEADKSVLNTELGDEGQEVVADPVDAVTAYREKTKARYEQKYNKKGAK